MKALGAFAALALAGCASLPSPEVLTVSAERAATMARASYTITCGNVLKAHDSGALTGQAFNTAKATCIDADAMLDSADAALADGKRSEAVARLSQAIELVETVKRAAP